MSITIDNIFEQPFVKRLEELGWPVYAVGGCVRDKLMDRKSKDVDIVVENIGYDILQSMLPTYGKVDLVGKSFGVIKFSPHDSKEIIDIAVPRKDKVDANSIGHKGIIAEFKHAEFNSFVSLAEDLRRRDFTINSIAMNSAKELIDPFNGKADIEAKLIRQTDPLAFPEDPLRMMRAVQFASRFDFRIEAKTLSAIKLYNHKIRDISGERILTELEKVVEGKGFIKAWELLRDTGLYKFIFGNDLGEVPYELHFIDSLVEFMYVLLPTQQQKNAYLITLKGDKIIARDISLLSAANLVTNESDMCDFIISCQQTSPYLFRSCLLPDSITAKYNHLFSLQLPLSLKELNITSQELMTLGFNGVTLGAIRTILLRAVMNEQVENNNTKLKEYAQLRKGK